MFLNVSDTLDIEGDVHANGENYGDAYSGGGSGGSIMIKTRVFEGSGSVQVCCNSIVALPLKLKLGTKEFITDG